MEEEKKILKILSKLEPGADLKLIEHVYEKIKMQNRMRIYSGKQTKVDEERPDLLSMKV